MYVCHVLYFVQLTRLRGNAETTQSETFMMKTLNRSEGSKRLSVLCGNYRAICRRTADEILSIFIKSVWF